MKAQDLVKLQAPFPAQDIEWRLQSCGEKKGKIWGKVLAYITSRAVQERLDTVCGPDGWQCSIQKEGDAYLCTLSVRVEHDDGTIEWISRTDGADATDIEAVKGGISGAIKRASVLFGCGRYLYQLKDNWAIVSENGAYAGKTKEGKWFNWDPPALPDWALPENERKTAATSKSSPTKKEVATDPEITEKIQTVESYIKNNKLNKDWIPRANQYINNQDKDGLNRIITYVTDQEKVANAFDNAS